MTIYKVQRRFLHIKNTTVMRNMQTRTTSSKWKRNAVYSCDSFWASAVQGRPRLSKSTTHQVLDPVAVSIKMEGRDVPPRRVLEHDCDVFHRVWVGPSSMPTPSPAINLLESSVMGRKHGAYLLIHRGTSNQSRRHVSCISLGITPNGPFSRTRSGGPVCKSDAIVTESTHVDVSFFCSE